MAGLTVGSVNS